MSVQSFSERRVVRNSALARICFLRADDRESILIFKFNIKNFYNAAESNSIFRRIYFNSIHDFHIFNQILDLCDFGIQFSLLRFCFIILRVLGKVTKASRFLDLFRDFLLTNGFLIQEKETYSDGYNQDNIIEYRNTYDPKGNPTEIVTIYNGDESRATVARFEYIYY